MAGAVDPAEHVGLAVMLARKYGPGVRDPEGVLEVAVLALLGAARRFDPALGAWGAYASTSVVAAVRGEVGRQLRAPRETSLYYVTADGDEVERSDLPHVEPLDGTRLLAASVRSAVAGLPEREARIVRLRYGLDGEPWTLDAIGADLGLSRSRVAQLEARALGRLRRTLRYAPLDTGHKRATIGEP